MAAKKTFGGQIEAAKKAGYTDDQIIKFLGNRKDAAEQIQFAQQSRYTPEQTVQYLSLGTPIEVETTPEHELKPNDTLGFVQGAAKPFNNVLHWGSQGLQAMGVDKDDVHAAGRVIRDLASVQPGQPLPNEAQLDELEAQANAAGQRSGKLGHFAGSVAGVAPTIPLAMAATPAAGAVGGTATAARFLAPAIEGGVQGALTTENPDDIKGVAQDAALGAVLGKAADSGLRAVGSMVNPQYGAGVQEMLNRGVRLTPGEILSESGPLGRAVQKVEEASTSIPLLGDIVGNAKNASKESFNVSLYDDVARQAGVTIPRGTPAGRQSIAALQRAVGAEYDNLIPQLSFRADRTLANDLTALQQHIVDAMPDQYTRPWRDLMRGTVGKLFDNTGNMTGQAFKTLESRLSERAAHFRSSSNPFDRDYGDVLHDTLMAIRENVARSNPAARQRLEQLNAAYSNLATIENASIGASATRGVFSPEQYNQAVQNALKGTTRRRRVSGGEARNQRLSENAMDILGTKVHETGSMTRGLVGAGGAALALGMMPKVAFNPVGIGVLGAGLSPYLPGTRDLVRNALVSRPQGAAALRRAIEARVSRKVATAAGGTQPAERPRKKDKE